MIRALNTIKSNFSILLLTCLIIFPIPTADAFFWAKEMRQEDVMEQRRWIKKKSCNSAAAALATKHAIYK